MLKILETRITVIDCPKTGYDEDVDYKCTMCDFFNGMTTDAEVECNYEEDGR